ncbi:MAG TPA: envelope stress response membrane protein PspB [Stellaceae bacterium]|nr:envelope stress response membrane protein PspB [Stellaceae bacterium]
MHFTAFVLGLIFLTIVAPIWIIAHYLVRWRATRAMSREDQRTLGELWENAQRVEARIEALEKILDAEAPGWRPHR